MRFSAAIRQIAARDLVPEQPAKVPAEPAPGTSQQPLPRAAQEPPPDLDQRVRLSGEW